MPERTSVEFQNGRKGRVMSIETPSARHTIMYGMHTRLQDPSLLPNHFDALFLEATSAQVNPRETASWAAEHPQYREVVAQAQTGGIQLFFGEAHINPVLGHFDFLSLPLLETALGGTLVLKGLYQESSDMPRRRFLKLMTALSATYLSLPLVSLLTSSVAVESEQTQVHQVNSELTNTTHNLHPEYGTITLVFRNTLVALKQQDWAKRQAEKPHIVSVWGALHTQFETAVKKTFAENLSWITNRRAIFGIPDLVIAPSTLWTYTRVDWDKETNQWKPTVYEVPELKQLFSANYGVL